MLEALARRGIFGGLDLTLRYPELGNALLVCATETKLDVDIEAYAGALADIMGVARRRLVRVVPVVGRPCRCGRACCLVVRGCLAHAAVLKRGQHD